MRRPSALLVLWSIVTGCLLAPMDAPPTLQILEPRDGSRVCGTPLRVELAVEHFDLIPLEDPARDGAGHVDLFLNGQSAAMSDSTTLTIENVAEGAWQLRADLVAADHTAIQPYVGDYVYFTVDPAECAVQSPPASARLPGPAASWSGWALLSADLDADAVDEIIVGGPASGDTCWYAADASTPAGCVHHPEAPAWSGASLATGDWNDDGIVDLAVGAHNGASTIGLVEVYFGPLADLVTPDTVLYGRSTLDSFGITLATGDLDGDGVDDLVVGASGSDVPAAGAGAVYVFSGPFSANTLSTDDARNVLRGRGAVARHADSDEGGDAVGLAVAIADFDGDGDDDLAVGAGGDDTLAENSGRIGFFLGPVEPGEQTILDADHTILGVVENGYFGEPIRIAGDLTGDGRTDLFASVNEGATATGYLFDTMTVATVEDAWASFVARGNDRLGWSFAGGRDVDGDGDDDAVIGAPFGGPAGEAYVLRGPLAAGAHDLRLLSTRFAGEASGDGFGWAAAIGDRVWFGAPFANDSGGMTYAFDL